MIGNGMSQQIQQTSLSKRTRDNFDFNWQFHKGNIAMKRSIKAGGQGGLTDANVKVITTKDTIIDYADVKSATVFYPKDWQLVDVPHDWVVENSFVKDNSMGSQPAVSGYLLTGIGFYRKEFEIPDADKGKKILIGRSLLNKFGTVTLDNNLNKIYLSKFNSRQ